MKKYFFTMAVMALFAIGFTASDEEESSNSESSAPKTEQKQESEADRKAREQKEEAERKANEQKEKENKKTKLAKEAYDEGYDEGYAASPAQYSTLNPKNLARNKYVTWNGAPKTEEEKELCDMYIENYVKGWEEGHRNQ